MLHVGKLFQRNLPVEKHRFLRGLGLTPEPTLDLRKGPTNKKTLQPLTLNVGVLSWMRDQEFRSPVLSIK